MKKYVFGFVGIFCAVGICNHTWGAEIGARKSCTEIQAQINALSVLETPDDSQTAELTTLRETYRRDCIKRASGRARGGAGIRTPVVNADSTTETVTETTTETVAQACTTPDVNGCCPGEVYTDMGAQGFNCCPTDGGMCFAPMFVEPAVPEKSEAEIAAEIKKNIQAGLCADGTKPNKFGCCGSEVFKDLGNTIFACCPPDGGDCFPPIN